MRTQIRIVAVLATVLGLGACANVQDTPTRAAPAVAPAALAVQAQTYTPVSYSVKVPVSLRVSEANTYFPLADIVWRGDPLGDRHQQVASIFETALKEQKALPQGARPVHMEIIVRRFHSVTEKTRYTVGGWHSMTFDIALRDPDTKQLLEPVRNITTATRAYGGARAVAMDNNGITQKMVVTNHLKYALNKELTGIDAGAKVRGDLATAVGAL